MSEWKLFEGAAPEFTTAPWYEGRERAPHLEQEDHRDRLAVAADHALWLARHMGLRTAVDLGCGDGGLLWLIRTDLTAWGYDLAPANVAAARAERGRDVQLADVVADPGKIMWGALALATEMLEHLADPHGFTREIARHCDAIVASSPAFETDRMHYEFHTWAWDMDGYRALLEQAGFRVARHDQVRGFQVASGVKA